MFDWLLLLFVARLIVLLLYGALICGVGWLWMCLGSDGGTVSVNSVVLDLHLI